jgi:D-sedoheptulose 7-phosphate isomerase
VTGPAELFARRSAPGLALADAAENVAGACFAMAERFHRSGTLFAFGSAAAATDAQHVAVEFVHPVILGKRALPARSLACDVATLTAVARSAGPDEVFAHQLRTLAGPHDIALGLSADGDCRDVRRGLETASELGMLTVAMTGGTGGAIAASPAVAHHVHVPSADPLVVKEVHVTAYHVLWELVHVFFDQPGLLDGTACSSDHCITCSDEAVEVVVLEVLGEGLARVDTGAGVEEVSVALVEATVGDRVLVHAGEAIAVVRHDG